jgi:hypothetical protein
MTYTMTAPAQSGMLSLDAPESASLEAVVIFLNRDAVEPSAQELRSIVSSLPLRGRAYQDWMTTQTQIYVAVRPAVQDTDVTSALARGQLRRQLGARFNPDQIVGTPFELGLGGATGQSGRGRPQLGILRSKGRRHLTGVVFGQWRQGNSAANAAAPAAPSAPTVSDDHWSWWAERAMA